MRVWIMVAALALTACGAAEDESGVEAADGGDTASLDGKVKMPMFTKALWIDDELLELSCNQYFMRFGLTSETSGSCVPVTVKTELVFPEEEDEETYDEWTITAPTGGINITARRDLDAERLEILGTSYQCYLYTGNAYTAEGEEVFGGSFVMLAKGSVARTSAAFGDAFGLKGVFFNDQEACEALH